MMRMTRDADGNLDPAQSHLNATNTLLGPRSKHRRLRVARKEARKMLEQMEPARDPWSVEEVQEQFRCPACGERRMDYLIMSDEGIVTCGTCGAQYDPSEEQEA